jgi:molybdenum cofactor cytidylyltransferase
MKTDERVGAVILAAGESRRFGSPKQLAEVDGRTLLDHVIAAARRSGLAPVVAVVPAWLPRPADMDGEWLRWIPNPLPGRGMSHSLQLGLEALRDDADAEAAVILLGDQPGIAAETIAALLAARGERPIVAVEAEGVVAPPVLLERSQFGLAASLRGDQGLRDVLRRSPELVRTVSVAQHAVDVDTPADLHRP